MGAVSQNDDVNAGLSSTVNADKAHSNGKLCAGAPKNGKIKLTQDTLNYSQTCSGVETENKQNKIQETKRKLDKPEKRLGVHNLSLADGRSENADRLAAKLIEDSVFTFKPKCSQNSIKIAQSLSSDFMSRQKDHVDKQRKYVSGVVCASHSNAKHTTTLLYYLIELKQTKWHFQIKNSVDM